MRVAKLTANQFTATQLEHWVLPVTVARSDFEGLSYRVLPLSVCGQARQGITLAHLDQGAEVTGWTNGDRGAEPPVIVRMKLAIEQVHFPWVKTTVYGRFFDPVRGEVWKNSMTSPPV